MSRSNGVGDSEGGAGADELSFPADTMRERTGKSWGKMWFLITANRWFVAVLLLVATYLLLVVLGAVGPSSAEKLLRTDAAGAVFSSMIIAVVTSVTLVLTVAQLVLSQEIAPLGQQREEMREEIEFREDVEDEMGLGVSPPEPAGFLQTLIESSDERARALRDAVLEGGDAGAREDTDAYVEQLVDHGNTVREELDGAEFGTFEVLLPVLNYNYSWKIYTARRLREKHADSLSTDAEEAFEDLVAVLRFFGPAREYFKALYFQWEIINVSRAMLYGSMPALSVAAYMLFLVVPRSVSGTTLGLHNAFLFVSAIYVLTLVPFGVLLAYILRILTVVKRTLSIGPFILRETKRSGDIDGGE